MTELSDLIRARNYAARQGLSEFADDFAQEYLMGQFKGWKQTLPQALCDFVRKYKGDPRTVKGRCKSEARFVTNLGAGSGVVPQQLSPEEISRQLATEKLLEHIKEYLADNFTTDIDMPFLISDLIGFLDFRALFLADNKKSKAAELLGVKRTTFHERICRYKKRLTR